MPATRRSISSWPPDGCSPSRTTGNVVVLGATVARKHGVVAGDSVEIRGQAFEVLGTLQPTLTSPDITGLIPLATAQRIYLGDLPPLVAESLDAGDVANQIVVYPEARAPTSMRWHPPSRRASRTAPP